VGRDFLSVSEDVARRLHERRPLKGTNRGGVGFEESGWGDRPRKKREGGSESKKPLINPGQGSERVFLSGSEKKKNRVYVGRRWKRREKCVRGFGFETEGLR